MTGGINIKVGADLSGVKQEVDNLGKSIKDSFNQVGDSKGVDQLVDGLNQAVKSAKNLDASLGQTGGKAANGMNQLASGAKKAADEVARLQRLQASLSKQGHSLNADHLAGLPKDYDYYRNNTAAGAVKNKLVGVSLESFLNGAGGLSRTQRDAIMQQLGLGSTGGGGGGGGGGFGRFGDMLRTTGSSIGGAAFSGLGTGARIAGMGFRGAMSGGMLAGAGRIAAGLSLGTLALGAVRGIQATRAKIGSSEQEQVGYADMLRQMGSTSSTFEQLRETVRNVSKNLDVSFGDGSKMASTYIRAGGLDGIGSAQLGNEMRTAGSFSRMLGMDPEAGAGFFGTLRNNKVSGGDADNKRFAAMIGEAIARAGVFSKADEVMSAVENYTKVATSSSFSPANVSGYVGAMGSLMNGRNAGLDPNGAASLLATADAGFRHPGGEAQRNFMLGAMQRNIPGINAMDMGFMQDAGMFAKASDVFKPGNPAYDAADPATQAHYDKLAKAGGNKTSFQMVWEATRGMSSDMQRKNLMGLMPGLGDSGAARLQQAGQLYHGDLTGAITSMSDQFGIDTSKLSGGALRNVLDARFGSHEEIMRKADWFKSQGLNDEDKKSLNTVLGDPGKDDDQLRQVLAQLGTRYGVEQNDGDVMRKQLSAMDNLASDMATKLIPMTNAIREGISWLAQKAGFSDTYGNTDKAQAYLTESMKGGSAADQKARVGAMVAMVREHPGNYTKEFAAKLEGQYAELSEKAPDQGNGGAMLSGTASVSDRALTNGAYSIKHNDHFDSIFKRAGQKYGVDWRILKMIGQQESGLTSGKINRNKNGTIDRGIMQLNNKFDASRGIDDNNVFDPEANIMAGASVFSDALKRSHGSLRSAFANYNGSGPAAKQYAANSMALYDKTFGSTPIIPGSQVVSQGAGTQVHVVDVMVRNADTGKPMGAPARVVINSGAPTPQGAR